MAQVKLAHVELAERLQTKWLEKMERLIDSGDVTSTDLATLSRVFMSNGWSLDPSQLPQSLKDAIPGLPKAGDLDDDDVDVVGKIA